MIRRLQDRLQKVDEETGLIEDWREKCTILKSGMDAADEKVAQGQKAKTPEEIEGCYRMLKVRFQIFICLWLFILERHKPSMTLVRLLCVS